MRATRVLGASAGVVAGGALFWLARALRLERQQVAELRAGVGEVGPHAAEELTHDELRQRDLQRSAVLRSVTHDLRTPLAAIRAVVSDLHGGVEYDEHTRIELLQTVLDEIDRLDRVVGNLLAASRIEAGAMEPRTETVELDELLQHRVRRLASLLRDHRVSIEVAPEVPEVDADYGQIEQVVTNLLANAARYTPEGTSIEVSVSARADGRFVQVAVSDHGPGIPADIADQAFEPFVHGIGSRSTGLGLSICRSIIEAHGGAIGVESAEGGGATIWFTLPAVRPFDADRAQAGEA